MSTREELVRRYEAFSARRTQALRAVSEASRLRHQAERDQEEMLGELLDSVGVQHGEHLSVDRSWGSGWGCDKSPIKACIYDDDDDPWHDECLICGEPQERK